MSERNRRGLLAVAVGLLSLVAATAVTEDLEIWQIQGAGMASPVQGRFVTSVANVVTEVSSTGIFIQTPSERSDGDAQTSDGLFVFTGYAPAVASGDVVDVSGSVQEYYEFTRLTGPAQVTLVSSAGLLPSPVVLDEAVPSSLQPWPETELERFEGMRVAVAAGTTTAPSNQYGDVSVVAFDHRPFREPGIEYPGLPDLPVFDGNPEIFELDPDALGLEDVVFVAGTGFSAEGVLGYSYGDYQLWPAILHLEQAPPLPRSVRPAAADEVAVASQNVLRLFAAAAAAPAAATTDAKLGKLSRQIREVLGAPQVVAVQEVESLAVLSDLADRITADDPSVVYTPLLEEGSGYSGIDVGFLVDPSVSVIATYQVGENEVLAWDGSLLYDRPPLVLEAEVERAAGPLRFTVVNLHLRSLIGVDDPSDGPRVREKRHQQASWLSRWVQERQVADPAEALVLIGDFNAFEFSDGYVDVIGQISGSPDPAGALIPATDEVEPDLFDAVLMVAPEDRYSYVYRGSAQVLDHALLSRPAGQLLRGVAFARGNADAPVAWEDDANTATRCSDHDGLVLYLGGPRSRRGGARVTP